MFLSFVSLARTAFRKLALACGRLRLEGELHLVVDLPGRRDRVDEEGVERAGGQARGGVRRRRRVGQQREVGGRVVARVGHTLDVDQVRRRQRRSGGPLELDRVHRRDRRGQVEHRRCEERGTKDKGTGKTHKSVSGKLYWGAWALLSGFAYG